MSVLIGTASKDENGKYIGGKVGDQTKVEVYIRSYYSFGYTTVLRCKDSKLAESIATACEQGCENQNIGYSQSTRNTAYIEAQKVGFNISKIATPCNTDCSAFVTLVCVCGGIDSLKYSGNAPTTSTMISKFKSTGLFDSLTDSKYLSSDKYLKRGDILVAPGKHTVMVLSNGSNIFSITTLPSRRGIDVSAYNPINNYHTVKNAGVEFAILKIIRKDLNEDKLFATHLDGFTKANIPIYGVYNYSYATTVEKAKSDASMVIQMLKKYNLKCKVCMDVEDACQKNLGLKLIDIINAYYDVIVSNGYEFILYTGMSFYNSYIKPYKKTLKTMNEWIARYPSTSEMNFSTEPNMAKLPEIGTPIEGWQYSSKCRVNGINGVVDANILFDIADTPIVKMGTVYNCNMLNFREENSTQCRVLAKLTKNEKVQILDEINGWYKCIYNGKTGYCSTKYIKIN